MKTIEGYWLITPDDLAWRPSNLMRIPNADYLERTGSEILGARQWRLPPKSANTLHRHVRAEEFYFVLEGTGRIRIDDTTLTVPRHGGVLVGPGRMRQVFNDTDLDALWLIVGAPEELEFIKGSKSPTDLSRFYPVDPTGLPKELAGVVWPPGDAAPTIAAVERQDDATKAATASDVPKVTEAAPATARIDYASAKPEFIARLRAITKEQASFGLDGGLRALVETRVSQINGCAYCIGLHGREARERGESPERLEALSVWRESPLFTEAERAALAWAESLTHIAATQAGDADYARLGRHFSEAEIVELSLSISLANFWNRMAGGFRKKPTGAAAE